MSSRGQPREVRQSPLKADRSRGCPCEEPLFRVVAFPSTCKEKVCSTIVGRHYLSTALFYEQSLKPVLRSGREKTVEYIAMPGSRSTVNAHGRSEDTLILVP